MHEGGTGRGGMHCTASTCTFMPFHYCAHVSLQTESMHIKQVWGIGLLNIFMCQFPFDLDAGVETKVLAVLAGYDYVLLNSQFSYQV